MNNMLQISTKQGEIQDNFDEVRAKIIERCDELKTTVVTQESIAESKKFLANIRKEQKELDDERKAIKKAWSAPYEIWEKRAKELIKLYDEPIGIIHQQLNIFEEQRKEEKRKRIEEIFTSFNHPLKNWLALDEIYIEKWENVSYSEANIASDIEMAYGKLQMSVDSIKAIGSEFEKEGMDSLLASKDLTTALSTIRLLENAKNSRLQNQDAMIKSDKESGNPSCSDDVFDTCLAEEVESGFGEVSVIVTVPMDALDEFESYLKSRFFIYQIGE